MTRPISKFSPLTEATYYILLSLTQPLHGYGIIKKVEEMSSGRVKLAAGTLYGALSTLLGNRLIALDEEGEKNSRRKTYRMTPLGRALIQYEVKRLGEMIENGIRELEESR